MCELSIEDSLLLPHGPLPRQCAGTIAAPVRVGVDSSKVSQSSLNHCHVEQGLLCLGLFLGTCFAPTRTKGSRATPSKQAKPSEAMRRNATQGNARGTGLSWVMVGLRPKLWPLGPQRPCCSGFPRLLVSTACFPTCLLFSSLSLGYVRRAAITPRGPSVGECGRQQLVLS